MERTKKVKSRHVQKKVFTIRECENLQRIHQGSCSVGYMPNITILTLRDLWCLKSVHHFLPIIVLRDRVREIVESEFDCFGELYFEWTSINCWSKESYIRKHYDSNREYLSQRHYSALVYLNSNVECCRRDEKGFGGGLFAFTNMKPNEMMSVARSKTMEEEKRNEYSYITPETGLLICFSSGPENEHFVTKVEEGKRWVLTLWFTKDPKYAEPELKYFLPKSSGSVNVPSLWETTEQRIQLEKQLLYDAGFMLQLHNSGAETHKKLEQNGKSFYDTTVDTSHLTMELVSTVQHNRKVHLLVKVNEDRLRRLLQFSAYIQYVFRHSLGFAILNELENQTEATMEDAVLDYLDNRFEEWIEFEEYAIRKLEECRRNWLNESTELVGGVSSLNINPESFCNGKANTKQLFRNTFSPVVSIMCHSHQH